MSRAANAASSGVLPFGDQLLVERRAVHVLHPVAELLPLVPQLAERAFTFSGRW
jgi:hypothetical protein